MPPDSIPPGYRCIACGYDAGGLQGYVCPECAEPITDEAVVAWRARVKWQEQWGRLLRQRLGAAAVICIVYSAGAAILVRDVSAGGAALAALAAITGGSVGAGLLCSLTAQAGSRRAAGAIWLKRLWILHLPWLLIGPGSVAVLVAMVAEDALGLDRGSLVTALGLLGFMGWMALIVMTPVAWLFYVQDDFVLARLLKAPLAPLMVGAALIIAITAAVVGAAGGAVAVLAPLDQW